MGSQIIGARIQADRAKIIEMYAGGVPIIRDFMQITIEAFKDILAGQVKLAKRVKKLEQKETYYPNEEEIRYIKIGGTD